MKSFLELHRVPVGDWPELIDDLRDLEAGALKALNAARAQKQNQ